MHMKLNITVDSLSTMTWYVDASYGVHYQCKGHKGMMMTLGAGAAMSMSKAQKLNTGSSTESELVGVHDALPDILWGKYFLEAQGHKIDHNVLLQDNKSTILLATNGKMSSSKKTKHIRHRFFLIKDRVESGDVEIRYEPTGSMWCDILTKPKQGSIFRKFRGHLMNVTQDYDDDTERLRTYPLLLPKQDETQEMSTEDQNVLKKTTNSILFSPSIEFTEQFQRTLLRPQGTLIRKQGTGQDSIPQRVTNQVATPLKNRRSALGDHDNRSPQYVRYHKYLEMKGRRQTRIPSR